MHRHLLGIDWGNSNRRAYLIDNKGRTVDTYSDGLGMLAMHGEFAAALAALVQQMNIDSATPIVLSGMVGSAQGWREAPYLSIRTPLTNLPDHLIRVDDPSIAGRAVWIVPGYRQDEAQGGIDVMRGEEIQLLGAVAQGHADGWLVHPGTHSKWVLLRDGVIERFATFMTGELFSALSTSGTLAPLMGAGADNEAAFVAGLAEARRRAPLSRALFGVRARVVAGAMPVAHARDFVSGLLIGTEFVAAQDLQVATSVTLLGSPVLEARYNLAASHFGTTVEMLDADVVYATALRQFFEKAYT
jgi:2-dehydro-3-deoxygalactonokinase